MKVTVILLDETRNYFLVEKDRNSFLSTDLKEMESHEDAVRRLLAERLKVTDKCKEYFVQTNVSVLWKGTVQSDYVFMVLCDRGMYLNDDGYHWIEINKGLMLSPTHYLYLNNCIDRLKSLRDSK